MPRPDALHLRENTKYLKCKLIALAAPMTSVSDNSAQSLLGSRNRRRAKYNVVGNNDRWKGTATFGCIIFPLLAMA